LVEFATSAAAPIARSAHGLVRTTGAASLRPILMTSLATRCSASLPIAARCGGVRESRSMGVAVMAAAVRNSAHALVGCAVCAAETRESRARARTAYSRGSRGVIARRARSYRKVRAGRTRSGEGRWLRECVLAAASIHTGRSRFHPRKTTIESGSDAIQVGEIRARRVEAYLARGALHA